MRYPEPRKEVASFTPYVPGRSAEERSGVSQKPIKLASNESLWGPPRRAVEEARKALESLHIYPQPDPVILKEKIAERIGVKRENIILGNGADELIELVCKAYLSPSCSMAVSENSFIRYKMGGMLMGAEVLEVPEDGFRISPEKLFGTVKDNTKVVFIDNPRNPAGTFLTRNELEGFIENFSGLDTPPLVVVDEAYYEYASGEGYSTAAGFAGSGVPVMVLRTFSKAYGLAGLRIGYGVAHTGIIEILERIRPPFNTNRVAQAAAMGALEEEGFAARVARETAREKERLYETLGSMGVEYVRSRTNFILMKVPLEPEDFCARMLCRGVIIRPLAGYSLKGYVRVTVGKKEHNSVFAEALKEILAESRQSENEGDTRL